MGTDIHGVFQKRAGAEWIDIPTEYDFGRHYQLFAVLADVRNGFGFAGIHTGKPIEPIAEPRGLPDDFHVDDHDEHPLASVDMMAPWRRAAYARGEPISVWMGDHSFSWLSADEMLAWFEQPHTAEQTGVLSREERERWDGMSKPCSYCGGIWGGGAVVVPDAERHTRDDWTHVQCSWKSDLQKGLAYFFDEVKRLTEAHGRDVRFVFGFDS